MATLSKRATPSQTRMLRIIEGAVKNFMDAHPDWMEISRERIARSIAKRAVGTLSSQLEDVLALRGCNLEASVKATETPVTSAAPEA